MRYTHTHHFIHYCFVLRAAVCNDPYCPLLQAKVSPNFKNSYSETLAKLEHQYCKLLVSLSIGTLGLCVFEVENFFSVHLLSQLILLDHGRTLKTQ